MKQGEAKADQAKSNAAFMAGNQAAAKESANLRARLAAQLAKQAPMSECDAPTERRCCSMRRSRPPMLGSGWRTTNFREPGNEAYELSDGMPACAVHWMPNHACLDDGRRHPPAASRASHACGQAARFDLDRLAGRAGDVARQGCRAVRHVRRRQSGVGRLDLERTSREREEIAGLNMAFARAKPFAATGMKP